MSDGGVHPSSRGSILSQGQEERGSGRSAKRRTTSKREMWKYASEVREFVDRLSKREGLLVSRSRGYDEKNGDHGRNNRKKRPTAIPCHIDCMIRSPMILIGVG
ncbi:MAG: hypothetical protein OXF02_06035 [Simkaniaceae bacterium]|nr:hypothetical protein [Simkaniaceae bacterium]